MYFVYFINGFDEDVKERSNSKKVLLGLFENFNYRLSERYVI